tara:strand:+ start:863 stop:964 length:102 start_codon:yes stop_codon:yes gene_type:complete
LRLEATRMNDVNKAIIEVLGYQKKQENNKVIEQ